MNKEEILKYVTEVIKKQIPEKPDMYNSYDNDGKLIYSKYDCPKCDKSYDHDYDRQYNYCPRCGQALDWSEEG